MKESISGYDIIGDIHGHAEELKQILLKMGYELKDHVWAHPERKAVFVGDYIDRGPEIRQTLYVVKKMVDAGAAYAIMGNHEYNALAFHHTLPDGSNIRKHSHKNLHQHYETLKQFQGHQKEWEDYLDWFANLPLFLELDGIRVVHACWQDGNIEALKRVKGPLTGEILQKANVKETETWRVFEETLKGKEMKLPNGHFFLDKDGHPRTKCRTKWWMDPKGLTLEDYLFHAPPSVRHLMVPDVLDAISYGLDQPTVFFGHYWLDADKGPVWQAPNVCCLDYSVAKDGKLVAYRHYFDQPKNDNNFIIVNAIE